MHERSLPTRRRPLSHIARPPPAGLGPSVGTWRVRSDRTDGMGPLPSGKTDRGPPLPRLRGTETCRWTPRRRHPPKTKATKVGGTWPLSGQNAAHRAIISTHPRRDDNVGTVVAQSRPGNRIRPAILLARPVQSPPSHQQAQGPGHRGATMTLRPRSLHTLAALADGMGVLLEWTRWQISIPNIVRG